MSLDMIDSDSSDDSEENNSKPEKFGEYTILTKRVRQSYFQYLERELRTNFFASTDGKLTPSMIRKCAKKIEKKAIQSCVITQLYQRKMIEIIHNVRQQTENSRLDRHIDRQIRKDNIYLKKLNTTVPKTDNTVQILTENGNAKDIMNTTTEINDITITLVDKSAQIVNECKNLNDLNERSLVDNFQDDEIERELDHLFGEEENTEFDDIFGLNGSNKPDDPQIVSILNEIRNAEATRKLTQKRIELVSECAEQNKKIERQSITPEVPTLISSANDNLTCPNNSQLATALQTTDLSKSLWPCELFMQRRCLSERLAVLVEKNIRWHDLIQTEFEALFGEDSDDEFGICSPSIELDDILLQSCTLRISPWIVKYLTQPFREGLIANRFLFKKLAKRLAYKIIRENQYPNERFIKRTVENFFCKNPMVRSIEDINIYN